MLKERLRYGIALISAFIFCSCIDPYIPKLNGYESLLVVDGLLTDANSSYTVKLSRTFQEQNSTPPPVSDATVFISDDAGNINNLINGGSGIYKTDSTQFIGIPGRTYVLHIKTSDGEEYESDACLMNPVPAIDSIYFEKDQQLINNETQTQDGISIYLDSKQGANNQYYRWAYEETWKFKVQDPKKYDYIKTADPDDPIFMPIPDVKEFCWKNRQSDEIMIRSISEGQPKKISKQPIFFIATDESDRLLLQYSILVKQFSISKNEFDFWNNLKQVNETGGDIFARQPYTVLSNIHSIKNPKERVLGFFQVSAVSQQRKYILYRDVALMGLPFYSYPCKTWEYNPGDFATPCMCPPPTWDIVYWHLCVIEDYIFIEPKYNEVSDLLLELVFTRPECADCELAGTSKKPDFWVDMY
jgi:Domain of unknown function (DUF4249)